MSNPRKKSGELAAWLDPTLHVWQTKGGELTIINLRNCAETLKAHPAKGVASTPEGTVPAPRSATNAALRPGKSGGAATVPPPASAGAASATTTSGAAATAAGATVAAGVAAIPSPAAGGTGKDRVGSASVPFPQRSVNTAPPGANGPPPPHAKQSDAKAAASTPGSGGAAAAEVSLSARIGAVLPNIRVKTVSASGPAVPPVQERHPSPKPMPASSAPAPPAPTTTRTTPAAPNTWRESDTAAPSLGSEPVSRTSAAAATVRKEDAKSSAFEFVAGTNIPGRGVVGATDAEEPAGFALFHDPLWGSGTSTWSTSAVKKTATPLASSSNATLASTKALLDIFGPGPKADTAFADKVQTPPQLFGHPPSVPAVHSLPTQMANPIPPQQATYLHGGFAGVNPAAYLPHHSAVNLGGVSSSSAPTAASYLGGVSLAQPHLASTTLSSGYQFMGLPTQYVSQPQSSAFASPGMVQYGMNTYYTVGASSANVSGATTSAAPAASQGWSVAAQLAPSAVGNVSTSAPSTPPTAVMTGTNVEAKPFVPGSA